MKQQTLMEIQLRFILPGSSPEIAITERGLQDVALMLDITVNTKLYCYLTYIVDDTHIETEKVTVEVYLSPITK